MIVDWAAFVEEVPERVERVIEDGPSPLKDYPTKLDWDDKKLGLLVYKGGSDNVSMKAGQAGVVYFDPEFVTGVKRLDGIPKDIVDKHRRGRVIDTFHNM